MKRYAKQAGCPSCRGYDSNQIGKYPPIRAVSRVASASWPLSVLRPHQFFAIKINSRNREIWDRTALNEAIEPPYVRRRGQAAKFAQKLWGPREAHELFSGAWIKVQWSPWTSSAFGNLGFLHCWSPLVPWRIHRAGSGPPPLTCRPGLSACHCQSFKHLPTRQVIF